MGLKRMLERIRDQQEREARALRPDDFDTPPDGIPIQPQPPAPPQPIPPSPVATGFGIGFGGCLGVLAAIFVIIYVLVFLSNISK